MRQLGRQVLGEHRMQVVIGQAALVERQKMQVVLFRDLDHGRLRSAGEDDHRRDLAVPQLLERFVVVVVHALDVDLEHVEDDLRGDLGLAVLEIEAHLLAAQVVELLMSLRARTWNSEL